ncbi:hypothetical protein KBD45_04330 [Candidatus Dojkabacteria bacterium]|nr:hypothetical protein [Candidatus Dojkabacteria bacterium]
MEYSLDNIHSFIIPVKTALDSGFTAGYGFVHEGQNRTVEALPQNDFFIPVFITRTGNLMEYVNITRDDTIFVMERQEVNPWFIEFSFFDTIKRNKVNEGADLSAIMINYIRSVRPEVSSLVNSDIKVWFDNIGRYEIPWNKGTINEITLDTLDQLSLINQNIISKAKSYKIDINK